MQILSFGGPFVDRNPDFTGVPWQTYGPSTSHIDNLNTTGYFTQALDGQPSLAHAMEADDGRIPSGSTIRSVLIRVRLGNDSFVTQGALAVLPYVRYDGGAPVFQEQLTPPYDLNFLNYEADFPRDPDGLPWTRASIYRKRGKLLLFGLRPAVSPLLSAQIKWAEARFQVNFDLPIPLVQTDPASLIGDDSARLNGRVNPGGANGTYPLTYFFQWGKATAYGDQTTPVANVTGDVDLLVFADLTGLEVGVGYHFRLVARTSDGDFVGEDQFFTTDATATGRWRLDEFKRVATGQWLAGDRTRMTSRGFDRPSAAVDDATCPFLIFP